MEKREMNLAAFVVAGPVSGHHGGWRYPTADRNLLSVDYYRDIGRILEDGRFDLIFFADILAIPSRYQDRLDSQLRYGALGALRLDPMIVLAAMAASTKYLGLACTISTSYFHPFAVARAMATLDHLSEGRAAWNIVTSFQQAEANNFGLTDQLSRDERYDRADEFLGVTCKLWDSWGDAALVIDVEKPKFADPKLVKRIDHKGKWFDVQRASQRQPLAAGSTGVHSSWSIRSRPGFCRQMGRNHFRHPRLDRFSERILSRDESARRESRTRSKSNENPAGNGAYRRRNFRDCRRQTKAD